MQYAHLAMIAVLATIIGLQHYYSQRHILEVVATHERILAEERSDRQMLLQRIQDPERAPLDYASQNAQDDVAAPAAETSDVAYWKAQGYDVDPETLTVAQ